jgi:hypothetical protein
MRRLAEMIAVNRKNRVQIEAEADISVRQTQLDATKQRLLLNQQEEEAQINQRLELEKVKAHSDAESARSREESQAATESARISREQETRMREIEKQRELRKSEIEAQLNSEVRKLESSITLSSKQAEEAHAQAAAELARTEVILAQEKVQTDRERAIADRSLEMAVKRVKEAGEVAEANAATEVTVLLKRAKAEAEATHTRAAAEKARMLAESEGSRALIDAENALSTPVLHMKLEQYRLDRMPEIMSHMMKPIEKIDSIRINHVSGFGASQGGSGGGASDEGGVVVANRLSPKSWTAFWAWPCNCLRSKVLATKSVSTCLGPSMLPAVNRRPRLTSKPVADPSISLIFIFPTQEQTAQFQEYHHELFTSPIFGWNWISRSDRTGRHDSLRDGFGTGRTHQIGLHSGQLGQPGCLWQTHGDGHHFGRRRNQCRWWLAWPQNPSGAIRLTV